MCDVGRAGAAFRRRQRQLRAFHRHEAMSVKLALATALHHSAQAGGGAERGGGVRDVRWPTGTEDSSTGRDAASQPGGTAGRTGAGAAAHHGAGCQLRAGGPAARCSCAADGGQVGGCAEDRRPLRPRAGDRRKCPGSQALPVSPLRRVLPVPQTTEQLVEVPLAAAGVVQAWVRDANGHDWSRVWDSSRRIFWWRLDSRHVQWNTPPGITASPGRYGNTGQMIRIFNSLVFWLVRAWFDSGVHVWMRQSTRHFWKNFTLFSTLVGPGDGLHVVSVFSC